MEEPEQTLIVQTAEQRKEIGGKETDAASA